MGILRQFVALGMMLASSVSTSLAFDPPATPHEPEVPSKSLEAGYRKSKLAYMAADGAKRERTLYLWYPADAEAKRFNYRGQIGFAAENASVASGRHPLILFSHGFWGVGDQTIFLMEALARAGYIVASPNHADAIVEHLRRPVEFPNFADAKTWDYKKHFDRKEDISALLDDLLSQSKDKGSFLYQHIDEQKIGAVGHSLGGYTVLGLAGARPTWQEKRIRAVIAYSPYALPYDSENLKGIKIPIMLQGGTLDFGITPFLHRTYSGLPAPKYFLILKNETHFGWTNLISLGRTTTDAIKDGNAKLMVDYSVAFFDQHLRGVDCSTVLQGENKALHSYRHSAK